jgi:hypothetical protein
MQGFDTRHEAGDEGLAPMRGVGLRLCGTPAADRQIVGRNAFGVGLVAIRIPAGVERPDFARGRFVIERLNDPGMGNVRAQRGGRLSQRDGRRRVGSGATRLQRLDPGIGGDRGGRGRHEPGSTLDASGRSRPADQLELLDKGPVPGQPLVRRQMA